ncbi:MAG TPA: MFS transporter [Pyrinomonadaceae bacterium]|jgi:fucose permease
MSPKTSSVRILKILLHFGFLLSGITAVYIGQVLPILTVRLSLDDRQAGNFFIAQFSGSLLGTLLSNSFGRRNKFIFASSLGCFLMASGIALLNFDSLSVCIIGFLVNGFGIGMTIPSMNMLTLELDSARRTSALNILNFFWGIGAISSQPFVDVLASGTNILLPTVILVCALLATGAAIAVTPRGIERQPVSTEKNSQNFDSPIWSNPIAWTIAAFNFIHVGIEGGFNGWLKTYTARLEPAANLEWFPPIFIYFLFFVAGRGLAPFFLRYLSENKMLFMNLLYMLLGICVLLSAENIRILGVGAAIAGFGTSSVFPTNLSRFTKFFGETASRRATPLFISGTLGAVSTTWLIGFLSSRYGNLRIGMLILLAGVFLMIFLQIGLGLKTRKRVTDNG